MATVEIGDVQAHLPEILSGLAPGEQLVIVQAGEPVATMIRTPAKQRPSKAGSAKHTKHWMAPDFNAPLAENEPPPQLPAWCDVYDGLTDDEIADLENVILQRADLTRD